MIFTLTFLNTATMKGLHKAIRSTTPAGVRTQPSAGAGSAKPERERTHQNSAQTPIFQSPRLPVKRKVSVDEPDLSPNSKHRRAALESTVTPKVHIFFSSNRNVQFYSQWTQIDTLHCRLTIFHDCVTFWSKANYVCDPDLYMFLKYSEFSV